MNLLAEFALTLIGALILFNGLVVIIELLRLLLGR